MTRRGTDSGPFPPRRGAMVRVDSEEELVAYLAAYPGAFGPWEIVARTTTRQAEAAVARVTVRSGTAEETIGFDVGTFAGGRGVERLGRPTTGYLDAIMHAADAFAAANGPQHPGSLPRFPVPSARYPGRVDVPMAVLAVDAGRRGLYAPPRVVTVDWATGEPYGVGEAPGFGPDAWPPARLGDWPPPGLAEIDRVQLQGMVARLSAGTTRLTDAWLTHPDDPLDPDDAAEMRSLLAVLELPAMAKIRGRLNPGYARALRIAAARGAA